MSYATGKHKLMNGQHGEKASITIKKIVFKGEIVTIQPNTTTTDIKRALALPDDCVLINEGGESISDGEQIFNRLKEGERITAIPTYIYGNPQKILQEYKRIKKAFPDAVIARNSQHYYILIPAIPLPDRFNFTSTPLLIRIHPFSDYIPPDAYVRRDLKILGYGFQESRHLVKFETEPELLQKGWIKICNLTSWDPRYELSDYIIQVIKWLEGLSE